MQVNERGGEAASEVLGSFVLRLIGPLLTQFVKHYHSDIAANGDLPYLKNAILVEEENERS